MASSAKKTSQTARQFLQLCLQDGRIDPTLVGGVLEYWEKHPPAHPIAVLKAFHRLVAIELAKSEALVEHAGGVGPGAVAAIAAAMSRKYNRPITASEQSNPALLAGLRIRVGDDIYESSLAGQLAALGAAV